MVVIRDSLVASQTEYCHRNGEEVLTVMLSTLGHGYKTVYIMVFVMMMMMMMSGFVERVIYSPDALSISQTVVERTSEGRELRFAERLVYCSR